MKIPTEHIDTNYSSDSKLQFESICCIRILPCSRNIDQKGSDYQHMMMNNANGQPGTPFDPQMIQQMQRLQLQNIHDPARLPPLFSNQPPPQGKILI